MRALVDCLLVMLCLTAPIASAAEAEVSGMVVKLVLPEKMLGEINEAVSPNVPITRLILNAQIPLEDFDEGLVKATSTNLSLEVNADVTAGSINLRLEGKITLAPPQPGSPHPFILRYQFNKTNISFGQLKLPLARLIEGPLNRFLNHPPVKFTSKIKPIVNFLENIYAYTSEEPWDDAVMVSHEEEFRISFDKFLDRQRSGLKELRVGLECHTQDLEEVDFTDVIPKDASIVYGLQLFASQLPQLYHSISPQDLSTPDSDTQRGHNNSLLHGIQISPNAPLWAAESPLSQGTIHWIYGKNHKDSPFARKIELLTAENNTWVGTKKTRYIWQETSTIDLGRGEVTHTMIMGPQKTRSALSLAEPESQPFVSRFHYGRDRLVLNAKLNNNRLSLIIKIQDDHVRMIRRGEDFCSSILNGTIGHPEPVALRLKEMYSDICRTSFEGQWVTLGRVLSVKKKSLGMGQIESFSAAPNSRFKGLVLWLWRQHGR